jgi:hypothetical protein
VLSCHMLLLLRQWRFPLCMRFTWTRCALTCLAKREKRHGCDGASRPRRLRPDRS